MNPHLTSREIEICRLAEVSEEDAAFLKSLTDKPIELLEIPNFSDYPNRAYQPAFIGIQSYTAYEEADKIVLDNFDQFQEQGKILFRGETLYLCENEALARGLPAETTEQATICIVAATADPYKIIEAFETWWPNCRITNEAVLKQLKKWDERHGLKIFHISEDFVAAKLLSDDLNYDALVKEIFAMCAEQENIQHSLEEEIEGIKKTGNITLWWD